MIIVHCPDCDEEMEFLGVTERTERRKGTFETANWYCPKCNNIYFKVVKENIKLEGPLEDEPHDDE